MWALAALLGTGFGTMTKVVDTKVIERAVEVIRKYAEEMIESRIITREECEHALRIASVNLSDPK